MKSFLTFQKVPLPSPHDSFFALRDEQRAAIEQTATYYYQTRSNPNLAPVFLWNAKPRFGKTLAAYCFAAKIHARKILIITNRPAVADSWYSDFKQFGFQNSATTSTENNNLPPDYRFRWIFTCSEATKRRLGRPLDVYTRKEQLADPDLLQSKFIHFISLQDIKSRDPTGFKRQNNWIFNFGKNDDPDAGWDLVIVDESHEGADTAKAFQVFAQIKSKFTLHLSGTPFKALANRQFSPAQIYNWSYLDEQRQKAIHSSEPQNPYATLPQAQFYTYPLSNLLNPRPEENVDDLSDPAELFRVTKVGAKERFIHEQQVQDLIKNLSNPAKSYPFSCQTSYDNLRHTFWLLPSIKACQQFKKLLLKDSFFKTRYTSADIILAAGTGDIDRSTSTALTEVQHRTRDPLNSHTITLSCGQLTTGVTVPAWTGVFILANCQSSSLYIQAAFRVQNPCDLNLSPTETLRKTTCYIFDFMPEQALRNFAYIADASNDAVSLQKRQQKVSDLLKCLPVFAEDEQGQISALNAEDIIRIPLRMASVDVLKRKFMSNRLFRNIHNIFGCPQEVQDIIYKLPANGSRVSRLNIRPRIWLDRYKVIHINEDIIIPTYYGFLSDRQYVELGTKEAEEITSILNLAARQARMAGYNPAAIRLIKTSLAKKLPQLVVQLPSGVKNSSREPLDSPPTVTEKTVEDKIRERLRNFARNVPILLLAYGNRNTTLANLDQIAPNQIFTELTGLTPAEFCKLRDGMEYQTKDETGKLTTQRFDGFFNETVFNLSIQNFFQKQNSLTNYYQSSTDDRILNYLPSQINGQVFTPRIVVKKTLDQLIAHDPTIFKSTTNTFLDLYMKSGIYLTEIIKQLFRHTRSQYSDDISCLKHILEHQIYGLVPTPIAHTLCLANLFGFDHEQKISRANFQELDVAKLVKTNQFAQKINEVFHREGIDMKFTAVVGNPPYIEPRQTPQLMTCTSSSWIYQHFQHSAEQISELTCLVYPFGGWFDSPERLGGFGRQLLTDGHTVSIDAYEATADRRAWYRNDRQPQPVFGNDINLSAGIAIVLRDLRERHDSFWYANRIYSDDRIVVQTNHPDFLPPNPAFHKTYQKLSGPKLCDRIQKNLFGIESNFVETHPHQVSQDPADWKHPIQLLVNDRAGSAGRAKIYWTDRTHIPKGTEYIDQYKVVTTSAYPKKTFVGNHPNIANVQARLRDLIEILPRGSAFGRSRLALFMSSSERECQNFLKYTQTKFFAALLLQEPNRRSSFGDIIPDQDFSEHSDIDWSQDLAIIAQQLCQKYHLSKSEIKSLGI